MIARLLSWLFPPKLPRVTAWDGPRTEYDEQGSVGPVRRKQYRDGIERHFAEERESKIHRYYLAYPQWLAQVRYAEKEMQALELSLQLQGYRNTVHDCWEKE